MKPRFQIKTLLLATAVIACLTAYFVDLRRKTSEYLDHAFDSHLLLDVGALTCDYLADNDDRWPSQWSDLEPYAVKRNPDRDAFKRIEERIAFDFSPEAGDRVRQASEEEITELKIARPLYMDRESPMADRIIHRYFHSDNSASSANSAVNP